MGQPVVHFEIRGKDGEKLKKFYADLFDWEIHSENPMNYGFVHTNSGDKGIGGGVTADTASSVRVVIEVDDLQKYLERAEGMGAKTVTPVTEIPGVVTFAEFSDPEGNVIGIVKGE